MFLFCRLRQTGVLLCAELQLYTWRTDRIHVKFIITVGAVGAWFIFRDKSNTYDLPIRGEIVVGFLKIGKHDVTDNLPNPFGLHSRLCLYPSDCRLLSTERCAKAGLSACWGCIWPDGCSMPVSHTLTSVGVFALVWANDGKAVRSDTNSISSSDYNGYWSTYADRKWQSLSLHMHSERMYYIPCSTILFFF